MPKLSNPDPLIPYWQTDDGEFVRLHQGHVIDVLQRLPAQSVHCIVTSPPYWGLRDYQTGTWEGGDPRCEHVVRENHDVNETSTITGGKATVHHAKEGFKERCPRCGARRIDRQLGSEPLPDCKTDGQAQCGRCYVCATVAWTREVRRVLRDDGVFWLNLGDSYNGSGGSGGTGKQDTNRVGKPDNRAGSPMLTQGNLVGIPWRVALALQADGWVLRQWLPWVKRSPMPESVKNRPAKACEDVFMFVRRMGYFYDDVAVKRVGNSNPNTRDKNSEGYHADYPGGERFSAGVREYGCAGHRNFWNADLWFDSVDSPHGLTGVGDELVGLDVTTAGYPGAHFATFPMKLVEPLILAGTSERGCCAECGSPWKRVVEATGVVIQQHWKPASQVAIYQLDGHNKRRSKNSVLDTGFLREMETAGWEPGCGCEAGVVPCIVLDPFIGSGTTCAVAIANGRRSIGVDLSEKYLRENAVPRVCAALVKYGYLKVVVRPPSSIKTLE